MLGPLLVRDHARFLGSVANYIEAARQATLPDATSRFASVDVRTSASERFFRPISTTFGVAFERALQLYYRMIAMRRMAAVALAMRLYEIDNGRRPAKLAELAPKYLPAIPADPFVAGGARRISYLPSAERPLLYCLGKNGIDDEGKCPDTPGERVDSEKDDVPFFLNGDRPRDTITPP